MFLLLLLVCSVSSIVCCSLTHSLARTTVYCGGGEKREDSISARKQTGGNGRARTAASQPASLGKQSRVPPPNSIQFNWQTPDGTNPDASNWYTGEPRSWRVIGGTVCSFVCPVLRWFRLVSGKRITCQRNAIQPNPTQPNNANRPSLGP